MSVLVGCIWLHNLIVVLEPDCSHRDLEPTIRLHSNRCRDEMQGIASVASHVSWLLFVVNGGYFCAIISLTTLSNASPDAVATALDLQCVHMHTWYKHSRNCCGSELLP